MSVEATKRINNQSEIELGEYITGSTETRYIDLSRFSTCILLFVLKCGKFDYSQLKTKRIAIKQELNKRKSDEK